MHTPGHTSGKGTSNDDFSMPQTCYYPPAAAQTAAPTPAPALRATTAHSQCIQPSSSEQFRAALEHAQRRVESPVQPPVPTRNSSSLTRAVRKYAKGAPETLALAQQPRQPVGGSSLVLLHTPSLPPKPLTHSGAPQGHPANILCNLNTHPLVPSSCRHLRPLPPCLLHMIPRSTLSILALPLVDRATHGAGVHRWTAQLQQPKPELQAPSAPLHRPSARPCPFPCRAHRDLSALGLGPGHGYPAADLAAAPDRSGPAPDLAAHARSLDRLVHRHVRVRGARHR